MMSALSGVLNATSTISGAIGRAFPTPAAFFPRAAGVDISDASVKWLLLSPEGVSERVQAYGEERLSGGSVLNGAVQDVPALAAVLSKVKEKLGGVTRAHASLPEEAAYVFSMQVPLQSTREQILNMIEFELPDRVPLPAGTAVYDFDRISENEGLLEIGVVVFAREFTEKYVEAFTMAGIELLSLELEARSIARAVAADTFGDSATMLVDFGRARSGIAILKRGIPIFSSTVAIGGEAMAESVMQKLSLSREEAQSFIDDEGLLADGESKAPGVEVLVGGASAFADEVSRHYHYWDTRRNDKGERMSPVGRVLLIGGSANMRGLPEYIAAHLKAPTEIPDVWKRIAEFDAYIPPIDRKTSLQYATAVGLALRGH